jgi:hypothetical protein
LLTTTASATSEGSLQFLYQLIATSVRHGGLHIKTEILDLKIKGSIRENSNHIIEQITDVNYLGF